MVSAWKVGLVLTIGVFAVSTSAIFTRLAFESAGAYNVRFSLVIATSRLSIASLVLLLTTSFTPGKISEVSPHVNFNTAIRYAVGAGFFLALHFAAWINSLTYTSIAASTTLVTTNPIWVTFISWIWFKEKPTLLTLFGIGVAFAGGITISLSSSSVNTASQPLTGNILALIAAWAASFYLLLGRESQRQGLSISKYITVAYTTSALVLLPVPFFISASYVNYPSTVYFYIALMALIPQLIGHTSFNWATRVMSPIIVTLVLLFEPIGASLLGYLIFKEVPKPLELVSAVVILAGVALAILGTRNRT
ncbi:MAG: DMT family transporter [Calothrix sp. C42_A2020_038]|nr:DMT family transporter [Calothrix sp. C42_A2020_038]